MSGTADDKEFIMRSNIPVSTTVLTKGSSTHVGWTATATSRANKNTIYYFGCNKTKCTKPTAYTASKVKSLGAKFVPYVFQPGEIVHADTFNALDGVVVNFSAYYCSSANAVYNKSTSTCNKGTPGNGTTVLSKYTATFDINGASKISKTSESCDITASNKNTGCTVTLPSITAKTGAKVLGWSDKKNATSAN